MTEQYSGVWFSRMEYRYNARLEKKKHVITWSKEPECWDWNGCTVSAVSISGGRIRVIIRSTNKRHSRYRSKDVLIRYMYGFDISDISEPELGDYGEPPPKNSPNKVYGLKRQRWFIHLRIEKGAKSSESPVGDKNKDCWIWEWADGRKKEETTVYQIYKMLMERKINPNPKNEIFEVDEIKNESIIPVVYQPSIDSWKNFVRRVDCYKLPSGEYEITLIMEGEQLRIHALFEWIYRIIRRELYHRLQDVETFKILSKNVDNKSDEFIPENFMFSGIYSDDNGIEEDDIHGNKSYPWERVPIHKIKYYFSSVKHPVVFINTSNHALAEHDNNEYLWKWEYVPWDKDSPVELGNKSRKEIEEFFRNGGKLKDLE